MEVAAVLKILAIIFGTMFVVSIVGMVLFFKFGPKLLASMVKRLEEAMKD